MRNAPWYASPRSIQAAALVGNRRVAACAALIAPSRSSRARRSSTRAANASPNVGDHAQASRSQKPARRGARADLSSYRWIVFTSRNTVDIVFDRLPAWGLEPRSLAHAAIAAIGPATAAALARRGTPPALVPERYVAEALIAALARVDEVAGARILLPRALDARDALPDGLRARGAVVDVVPVYRTVPVTGDGPALAGEILAGRCDAITFTSSSTVRHFVDQVGRAAATSGRFAAAVIGPVTAATARELGLRVAVEAAEYTVPGLVDALARYYGEGGKGSPKGLPDGRGEGA